MNDLETASRVLPLSRDLNLEEDLVMKILIEYPNPEDSVWTVDSHYTLWEDIACKSFVVGVVADLCLSTGVRYKSSEGHCLYVFSQTGLLHRYKVMPEGSTWKVVKFKDRQSLASTSFDD